MVISTTEHSSFQYKIDKQDEGLTQELQLTQALQLNFGKDTVHSPQVTAGEKTRELIDVLGFDRNSSYLIESKSLSVNDSGHTISQEMRLAKSIKHAHKALNQLEGAIKAIRREHTLTDSSGNPLTIANKNNLHGIAVISEFIQSDRWNEIIAKIESLSKSNKARLHVIELSEFIYMIKLSQRPTISFEQSFIERFEAVIEHRTLNIKGMDSSLPV